MVRSHKLLCRNHFPLKEILNVNYEEFLKGLNPETD